MSEEKKTSKNSSSKEESAAKSEEESAVETKEASAEKRPAAPNQYLIPASIVVAGIFMAIALFFSGGGGGTGTAQPSQPTGDSGDTAPEVAGDIEFAPISDDDHIFGDPDAPVKVIEYLDFNCGFCQKAHPTFEQLVENNDGQVAWVTRHFPVLGDLSVTKAEAAECVAELGGSDAYWEFADLLYGDTYFQADESQLASIASEAGVNSSSFQTCLNNEKYADKVQEHGEDARSAGGQGTPYSVVVAPNGDTFPVNGAQPLSAFQAAVDSALEAN